MGNQTSSLRAALENPADDVICRRAFDELDKDKGRVLHTTELTDFRQELAIAMSSLEKDYRGSVAKLDLLLETNGNLVDFNSFQEFLRDIKECRSVISSGWAFLSKDVLSLVFRHLGPMDLSMCCHVSRWWNSAAGKDQLWEARVDQTRAQYSESHSAGIETMRNQFYNFTYEQKLKSFQTSLHGRLTGTIVLDARSSGPRSFTVQAKIKIKDRFNAICLINERILCLWRGSEVPGAIQIKFLYSKQVFSRGLTNRVELEPDYDPIEVIVAGTEPMWAVYNSMLHDRLLAAYDRYYEHF